MRNLLLLVLLFALGVGVEQNETFTDDYCESILKEVRHELEKYVDMLEAKRVEYDSLEKDYQRLSDTAAKLRLQLASVEDSLIIYKIVVTVFAVFTSIRLLWWFAPWVCYLAELICGTVRGLIRQVTSLPARLRSSFWARAGAYEDIPMREFSVGFQPEAMLPNSPINPIEMYDQCIFKIFVVDSDFPDKLHFSGLGFWSTMGENSKNSNGHFVTAGHVLPSEGKIMLRSGNDENKKCIMEVSDWKMLEDYDVAYYCPPQRITTTLGLRKAKVSRNILKQNVIVTVCGKQVSSCGPLKPMEKTVYLSYEGSSVGGFSGSPYMSGRTVCGVHIGSSKESGMGIDAAFLSMKLAKTFKLESSEDYIYEEIREAYERGEELDWKQYGLDDVVVNVRGKDFFLDYYEFQEMCDFAKQGKKKRRGVDEYYDDGDFVLERKKIVKEKFSDVEGLPKNCTAPTPVLVVGGTPVVAAPSQPNPKLKKLSSLPDVTVEHTTGQQQTVAQLSEVLTSMSKSLNALVKKVENQERVTAKLSSRVYGASAKQPGKQEPVQKKD